MTQLPVLVIGGGQSGLAAGYQLLRAGLTSQIVDAGSRIGDVWRRRYDSLTLFTPRSLSALPGYPLAGDPEGYASRDEFSDYLERYARQFDLQVKTSTRVQRLDKTSGHFRAWLESGESILAHQVVVATGGFQRVRVPGLARALSTGVLQLTPHTYSSAQELAAETVLIVGDGATGRDIAVELSGKGKPVLLATGKPRRLFPERILGRSTWWWLNVLGFMKASPTSVAGKLMKRADPFPNRDRSLRSLARKGITIVGRLDRAEGRMVGFSHGPTVPVDAVIWATGYGDDFHWLNIPGALDVRGRPLHDGGVSAVEGLFYVGRPWQRNRASGLIMGVGEDAAQITACISELARQRNRRRSPVVTKV